MDDQDMRSIRFHDMDGVRALALSLGIALHAALSFMTPRIWLVQDSQSQAGFGLAFYCIHQFRMTLFFVVSGFFAHSLLQRHGLRGFILNRSKRLAIPLFVAWPFVLAAIIFIAVAANASDPAVAHGTPSAFSVSTFPLTHLWFLYILLILCTLAVILKIMTDVLRIGGLLGRGLDFIVRGLLRYDLISAVLIIPGALALYFSPSWLMWFGVMTPDIGLMPNLGALAVFMTAFGFGWFLHRSPDLLKLLAHRFGIYLLSAVIGTLLCLRMAGIQPALHPVNGRDHPLYILLYLLSSWSWVLAILGFAHRYFNKFNPAVRYLSDASYWVYIVHLPIVLLLQYLVAQQSLPGEAKYAVVLFSTILIALLTYQLMVRYTVIGTILNGPRRKSRSLKEEAVL